MKNIILTGIMGSGKSTAALLLKNIFPDFELIETDKLIEEKEGLSINEIFQKKGEGYFREIEKNTVREILKNENQIISLGGGSLENDFNFELSKLNSIMFYLSANVEILYERIKNNTERPLLKCENPKQKLKDLLEVREENYKKANYIIDVNNLSPNEVAQKITEIYYGKTRTN